MPLAIALGISLGQSIAAGGAAVVSWILSTGSWNDSALWNDTQLWKDS